MCSRVPSFKGFSSSGLACRPVVSLEAEAWAARAVMWTLGSPRP